MFQRLAMHMIISRISLLIYPMRRPAWRQIKIGKLKASLIFYFYVPLYDAIVRVVFSQWDFFSCSFFCAVIFCVILLWARPMGQLEKKTWSAIILSTDQNVQLDWFAQCNALSLWCSQQLSNVNNVKY